MEIQRAMLPQGHLVESNFSSHFFLRFNPIRSPVTLCHDRLIRKLNPFNSGRRPLLIYVSASGIVRRSFNCRVPPVGGLKTRGILTYFLRQGNVLNI